MSGPTRGIPIVQPRAVSTSSWPYGYGDFPTGVLHAVSVLTDPPTVEPLTVDQAKLRAGFTWLPGDERDALLADFIRAARQRVEMDTGLALPSQKREVYFDVLCGGPLALPGQCSPIQTVEKVFARLDDGTTVDIAPANYAVDKVSNPARITFSYSGAAPAGALHALQPWGIALTVGWETPETIPPLLVHAVGLLAGHYLTSGRDVIAIGTIATDLPFGYEHVISGYRPALVL